MALIEPFWFKQRQAKAEPAGTDTYRLTGPNLQEGFISVRKGENGKWEGVLRWSADGPEVAATGPEFDLPVDAWEAAFELYRRQAVV